MASYLPESSLSILVWMFPLRGWMSRSGRRLFSCMPLLMEEVPTFAPWGSSSSLQGRMTSSTASLSKMAGRARAGFILVGTSLSEFTEASMAFFMMASSSSRTNAPTLDIWSSGEVRSMSPRAFMPMTSISTSGLRTAIFSLKMSVCLMARALSRVPTFNTSRSRRTP